MMICFYCEECGLNQKLHGDADHPGKWVMDQVSFFQLPAWNLKHGKVAS